LRTFLAPQANPYICFLVTKTQRHEGCRKEKLCAFVSWWFAACGAKFMAETRGVRGVLAVYYFLILGLKRFYG
jgi:hypothetical protein